MSNPGSNSAAHGSSKYNKKPPEIYITTNETTGFTFRGPLTVEDDSKKDIRGPQVKREKKISRQLAVDLTLSGDRSPNPESYEVCNRGFADNRYSAERRSLSSKQSSFEKSALSLQSVGHNSGKQSTIGGVIHEKNNSRQLSLEKPQKLSSVKSGSSKPKFSRSATLEWTFEGPSSHVPSSDWIDSFTRQHGLANSSSHQRRSSFVNNARSSLDNPRTAMKHRVLSKSPSAPTQDSSYRSMKDYGSTNSSFEHHPSDPIPPTIETRVLVHNLPSSESLKKHEKSSSWSKKLGITGSQFLTTNWTSSSKRSPTYPLISPSSQSQSFDSCTQRQQSSKKSNSTSIELTSAESEVPAIDFYSSNSKSMRTSCSSSETSWITANQSSLNSAEANPVRRRIPVTKLHRSPSRSNRFTPEMSDTVVEVNSSGGSGWLSLARNQRAKIKKCRALGKLYTTVKIEDDDVSVLVTKD